MSVTTSADPREIINQSSMTVLQVIVVAIAITLNALDGFDLLSISFAAPGIAEEWGVSRAALGIVLSMELIGMVVGSVFLGGVADKIGRRPTILGCLVVMTFGMFMVTTASSIVEISIWRVLTGLGIGGMLAAINAVTAEFSNLKKRHLCISLMVIGYPIGGVLGGMMASHLLIEHDWRSIFYFGAGVTAVLIPLFYFLVPESVLWLSTKQPENALEKTNIILKRMGHQTVDALPVITINKETEATQSIFSSGLFKITMLVTLTYFLHVTTFYYILKWVPKIVTDMGFAASSAGGVLVSANVGAMIGGAIFGLLATKFDLRRVMMIFLLFSAAFVALFGQTAADLDQMSLLAASAGFFTNAGMVGMYALCVEAFPTHARAFGTGFVIGIGRVGAVVSPILAGFLFSADLGLPMVSVVMGMGSLLAIVALFFLKLNLKK